MVAGSVCSSLQTTVSADIDFVIVKVNLGKKGKDLGDMTQPHCLSLLSFLSSQTKSLEIQFNFRNLFKDWTGALEKYTAILV